MNKIDTPPAASSLRCTVLLAVLALLALPGAPVAAQDDPQGAPAPEATDVDRARAHDEHAKPQQPDRSRRPQDGRHERSERRPDGDRSDRGDRHGEHRLSPQEFNERVKLLREVDPDLATRLEQWRERSPERTAGMLRQYWPKMQEMLELKRSDPELFELRLKDIRLSRESEEVSRQLRSEALSGEQRQTLEQKLRESVSAHFEVRQQIRQHELQALEKRIAELRQRLEARQAAREQLIEDRLKTLRGEAPRPQW